MLRSKVLVLVIGFLFSIPIIAVANPPVEGKDFIQISNETSDSKEIEVVEFFMYGCHHCPLFKEAVAKWLKTAPRNIKHIRVPVVLQHDDGRTINAPWMAALAHYSAIELGILYEAENRIHSEFGYKSGPKTEDDIVAFFTSLGIDKQRILGMMGSFIVKTRMKQAVSYADRYAFRTKNYSSEITKEYLFDSRKLNDRDDKIAKEVLSHGGGVPMLVVNGKYKITSTTLDEDFTRLDGVLNHLVGEKTDSVRNRNDSVRHKKKVEKLNSMLGGVECESPDKKGDILKSQMITMEQEKYVYVLNHTLNGDNYKEFILWKPDEIIVEEAGSHGNCGTLEIGCKNGDCITVLKRKNDRFSFPGSANRKTLFFPTRTHADAAKVLMLLF